MSRPLSRGSRILIGACALACLAGQAQAARLTMNDKASIWPRASAADKIDFATRMGKSFQVLSPQLDKHYFMRCLEETANIGDPKELRLEEMVRTCVSLSKDKDEEK